MSFGRARAIAYGAMALFGVAAVAITSPLPRASELSAVTTSAERGSADAASGVAGKRQRFDTLGARETLVTVLGRAGLSVKDARSALSSPLLPANRIRVGMPVHTSSGVGDSAPTEIVLGLAVDQMLHLRRDVNGWAGEIENLPWTTDTITVAGSINSNLTAAVIAASRSQLEAPQRLQLTYALADLYEFRVDMTRDLRVGDSFIVVAERQHGPHGAVRMGRVLAAEMKLSGESIEAIPFKSTTNGSAFFDATGRPLRCCFLRAPLEFRRISSGFGLRKHPILGTMRRHEGTDYAADAGTPVRAIGDGIVVKAGWGNGYGNVVELRHPNGFVSRYGHLQRFAKGIRVGTRVKVGNPIAYVGSTGLSTGPHLHFEVIVNGSQRDPRRALGATAVKPIPDAERRAFAAARSEAESILRIPVAVATADTDSARRTAQQ